MKKIMIKVISFLALLALLGSMTLTIFAEGNVIYDAGSDKFIFKPGSEYSPTDLFSEYKDVMPGDSIKQKITVKNDSSNEVKVKIYVRSLGAHEDSVDFLSKLHLSVAKDENNIMAYMFDAAADVTDGMTDWVYLGTLFSGGEVNLVLNLDVPVELGNEYQDAIGYIDWEFKVEELPVDPDDPKPPQTGDTFGIYFWIMLMVLSGIILVVLSRRRRKVYEG